MSKVNQKTILHDFFESKDIAILVYFRIVFGILTLWWSLRFFIDDPAFGSIARNWIDPTFHFSYYGFDWIKPLPGDGMYVHFAVLAILSVCITLGFKYRITTALFFVGFTYVFLLDQSHWSNSYYIILLISFLMILVPAHRSFSIDVWKNPKIQSNVTPAWSVWILRFQIGAVYFFGGLAKLNSDWLNGEPLRTLLATRTHFPLIGEFFREEWLVLLFSYGALFIDLLAVPFLLWHRTRIFAFGIIVTFHVLNSQLFVIGVFPWFMIFATALFFAPNWPRIFTKQHSTPPNKKYLNIGTSLTKNQKVLIAILLIFIIMQISLPLRHYLYSGNASWTEEGRIFAWQMIIRHKVVDNTFYATDPNTGKTWQVDPLDDLSIHQQWRMSFLPGMILQYSHYLADRINQQEGLDNVEIRVESMVSLNGRSPQPMINSTVNLAEEPQTLLPKKWILPLTEQ